MRELSAECLAILAEERAQLEAAKDNGLYWSPIVFHGRAGHCPSCRRRLFPCTEWSRKDGMPDIPFDQLCSCPDGRWERAADLVERELNAKGL